MNMAEVVKAKKQNKIVEMKEKEEDKVSKQTKSAESKKKTSTSEKKQSIWTRFMIYCHGVKSEAKKVRWTSKKDMVKYSIATIIFIIFCSLFFYGIDTIFALIQALFK